MQKIKIFLLISITIFCTGTALAQSPPVPSAPAKQPVQKTQTPQIHEVHKKQTPDAEQPKDAEPPKDQKQELQTNKSNTETIKTKEIKNTKQHNTKIEKKSLTNKFKIKKHPKPVKQNVPKEPAIKRDKPLLLPVKKQENKTENKPVQTKDEKTVEKLDTNLESNTTINQDNAKPSQINDTREQAKFLYNSNKLAQAAELFNKIPDSEKISDDWLFLANIAQDNERPIDAVFFLKKAIAADDNNYKAHYNLGNLYYYDNKINLAMSEYKKAIKLKKDFAYAYYNKGCCYLKKESWFNARYEFGLAIKANPNEPAFYYNLAYTYKMMKKDKKAQEALEMYNKLMTQ